MLVARDLMFGGGSPFRYERCPGCGCLHLLDVPADLSRHYPADYYSYAGHVAPIGGAKALAKRARTSLLLTVPRAVPRQRKGGMPSWARWFRAMRLRRSSRILDVGCGWGENLAYLRQDGFTNLAGVDAHLPEAEIDHGGGLVVRRAELADVEPGWDVVMLHHSFEHLPDPRATMAELSRVARPSGWVLIRTPLADSWAARTYQADWVALDAPRHLVVHTRRSIDALAAAAGFAPVDVFYDSWSFQLWGSEQYRAGIPLRDPRSHAVDPAASMFTDEQIRAYEVQAEALNRSGQGDQAGFVLRAPEALTRTG